MRDYGKVSPRFWTGTTGKRIRDLGPVAQVVALYLLTCPASSMTGLYYLPLPTLAHETGLPIEGASEALRRLSEADFAHYDVAQEVVWVPEMARFQIAEELAPRDKQIVGIIREVAKHKKCRFVADFYERYRKAFHLPDGSPYEGPPKAPRSQDQDQEQEQERGETRVRATPPSPAAASPRPGSGGSWGGLSDVACSTVERPNALEATAILDAVLRGSDGKVDIRGPAKTTLAFVEAVREAGYTLAEVATLGRYIAAGECAWARRSRFDLGFFVAVDRTGVPRLSELVTKATEWAAERAAARGAPAPAPPLPAAKVLSMQERAAGFAAARRVLEARGAAALSAGEPTTEEHRDG